MAIKPNRRGFSLLELLVVIGVVVLLASIAIPAFMKVRETSRKAVCSSNLRNLGVALQLFSVEHHGVIPLWHTPWETDQPANRTRFYLGLAPYLNPEGSGGIWIQTGTAFEGLYCPAQPYGYGYPVYNKPGGGRVYLSYACNVHLEEARTPLNKPTSIQDFPEPSKIMYLVDGYGTFSSNSGQDTGFELPAQSHADGYAPSQTERIFFPHDHQTNVLYLDGHTELLEAPISPDKIDPWFVEEEEGES